METDNEARPGGGMPVGHYLSRFPCVSVQSADLVRQHFALLHPNAAVEPQPRAATALAFRVARVAWLNLAEVHGQGFCVTACLDADDPGAYLTIALPLPGAGPARLIVGGHDVALGGRRAAVLPPSSISVPFLDGLSALSLRVPPALVTGRLQALLDRPVSSLPRFEPQLDLDDAEAAAFHRTVQMILHELDHLPQLVDRPLVTAGWQDLLLGSMLGLLPHGARDLLAAPQPDIAPWQVRRAEAWLEAHASEPVRMEEMAKAVGVSLRTIQHAFRQARGISPRAFLERCRLDLARRRLLAAAPSDTVTEIALACGFGHLSDFARVYKRRFGESPSVTLRRAR